MKTSLIVSLLFFSSCFPTFTDSISCLTWLRLLLVNPFIYLSWIQYPTPSPTLTLGWMTHPLLQRCRPLAWVPSPTLLCNPGNLSLIILTLILPYRKKAALLLFKVVLMIKVLIFIGHTPSILAPSSPPSLTVFPHLQKLEIILNSQNCCDAIASFVHFSFSNSLTTVISQGTTIELLLF